MTRYVGLGECALCGYPDAGHRVWDAVADRLRAGETLEEACADYDATPDEVAEWVALADAIVEFEPEWQEDG